MRKAVSRVALLIERDDGLELETYLVPHEKVQPKRDKKRKEKLFLKDYFVSREQVEQAAGFLIFGKVPDSQFAKINGVERTQS